MDEMRNLTGYSHTVAESNAAFDPTGVFYGNAPTGGPDHGYTRYENKNMKLVTLGIDASRGVPTGPANAPRRFGVLACAYMGVPAL